MTKKKEEEKKQEPSVVDLFVAGDIDAVKEKIHDHVVKTVSNIVNGTDKEVPPPKKEEVKD